MMTYYTFQLKGDCAKKCKSLGFDASYHGIRTICRIQANSMAEVRNKAKQAGTIVSVRVAVSKQTPIKPIKYT